ncbi:HK97 family phage prohead protease [uncultured Phenylobacterium sp.]|uniref:HK97 family phage prohead protease n=1 Tax=uncultured Phenylobacterium sp. TaxID=349273 RepID=UPI0025CE4D20|nr:HK97 family phage prohead protease [uncultured Phenylobacterium sp.]
MTDTTQPLAGRAYSLISIRKTAEADARRTFSGIATTPTTDRVGDVVNPMGVTFKNPLPLLWQHKHDQPIGWVRFGRPTKDGIPFDAEIAKISEASGLKDRTDDAWLSLKHKLVGCVSIGFRATKWAWIGDYDGIEFQETEVYELSAVTIPANPDAVITEISVAKGAARAALIKSFDVSAPTSVRPKRSATAGGGHIVKLDRAERAGGVVKLTAADRAFGRAMALAETRNAGRPTPVVRLPAEFLTPKQLHARAEADAAQANLERARAELEERQARRLRALP